MASAAVATTAQSLNTRGRVMGDVNPLWQPQGSKYTSDFPNQGPIADTIHRRRGRPTSGHRKNNPHPRHLAHLRRLTNEPVCTVKTTLTQTSDDDNCLVDNMVSSMRAHYLIPPSPTSSSRRATRFGCNSSKRFPALGIVPTSPETTPSPDSEHLLPACEKQTTLMSMSHPFQFVPRRRRIAPPVADEGYIIAEPSDRRPDTVGASVPTNHLRARRRTVSTAPKTTLQVPGFDGGAPPDPTRTITGRKKRNVPDMTKLYSGNLPGWLKAF